MKPEMQGRHRLADAQTVPNRRPRRSAARTRPTARPRLEPLETRLALSTITVTSATDSGAGTLRNAIAAAQNGDTILFASNLKNKTIHLTSGELAITQSLTIQGLGSGKLDIDAGGKSRVFDITSPSAGVTIAGLTISGGRAQEGGGVFAQGGTLTLTDDVVSNNQAVGVNPGDSAWGGGVAVEDGGSLTATGTTFQGNSALGLAGANGGTAKNNGNGGNGWGGAVLADGSAVSLSGSTFLNNRAMGGAGGSGGAGEGTSSSQASNDNAGSGAGGGIYLSQGALSIAGSTFLGNLAQGGAGGSAVATDFAIDYAINDLGGLAAGGAVGTAPQSFGFGAPTTVMVSDSLFVGNVAQAGADGPAPAPFFQILNLGAAIGVEAAVAIDGSTFVGNRAVGGTVIGGVVASNGGGESTVNDSTFLANQATGQTVSGGVLFSYGLAVSDSTFTGNAVVASGAFVGGGTLLSFDFSISSSQFDDNLAETTTGSDGAAGSTGGSGGYIQGGVLSNSGVFSTFSSNGGQTNTFRIADSTFDGNEALAGDGGAGGAGAGGGQGGTVEGGDVYLPGWLTVTDSLFIGTRAIAGDGGPGGAGGGAGGAGGQVLGGAIDVDNIFPTQLFGTAPVDLDDTTILGTFARGGDGGDGAGGGGGAGGSVLGGAINFAAQSIFIFSGPAATAATLTDTDLSGNVAQGGRGGNGMTGGDGGNAEGGGVFVDADSTIDLQGGSITGNLVLGGAGGGGNSRGQAGTGVGGGVYLTAPGSSLLGTKIRGNFASTGDDDVYGSFS